jgi:hypothetical protein
VLEAYLGHVADQIGMGHHLCIIGIDTVDDQVVRCERLSVSHRPSAWKGWSPLVVAGADRGLRPHHRWQQLQICHEPVMQPE